MTEKVFEFLPYHSLCLRAAANTPFFIKKVRVKQLDKNQTSKSMLWWIALTAKCEVCIIKGLKINVDFDAPAYVPQAATTIIFSITNQIPPQPSYNEMLV